MAIPPPTLKISGLPCQYIVKKLYEILVPTQYGDTLKPISTKHHKNWDAWVRKISNGLTVLKSAKGQWIHKENLFEEKVIPVRIFCTEKDMKKIVDFSFKHYRQHAIMFYVVSNECFIVQNPNPITSNAN